MVMFLDENTDGPEQVECKRCHALILARISEKYGGVCMRCFKNANHGLDPDDLKEIRKRGLEEFLLRWLEFNSFKIPKVHDDDLEEFINHTISTAKSMIFDHLRKNSRGYKPDAILELLKEVPSGKNRALDIYVEELKSYVTDLGQT